MWQDKILYWAWNGLQSPEYRHPPTIKRIVYGINNITVQINGPRAGELNFNKIAIGVWDDDVFKMHCAHS